MRETLTLDGEHMVKAGVLSRLTIPFYASLIRAGFPSPAENYVERVCDLNDLCVTNQEATYFVRVTGDSMTGDRIEPGDVLIVDCSREAVDGKIAVVWYNGEYTVKRLYYAPPLVVLMPSNHKYEPIYVHPDDDFRVFGTVTFVIQKTH
ncbi:translesion error-prone DNA polymerase V autoproteolytic subunit [Fibrella sp. HMF5335]|uniref:Translesion error-prone DNA polymerase V autoproteolytic subunit n=1 Tax=Fibrella rubiginis TaxID=2817060 RepID=A0A939GHB0_9BACT|nr:translesion error-prone DNA polymerase V autoproteolytic subunit [Fibrella rubiginis]MBO0936453.1 translesion error-prone DNA polymerase V autoproteolytic subunit [Fibrella rubiginis]